MNSVDKLVQKKLMEAARAVGFLEGYEHVALDEGRPRSRR